MNTLAGLLGEPPVELEQASPIDLDPDDGLTAAVDPAQEEQIQALVQQLFLQGEPRARHVGFAALEPGVMVGRLCFQVAWALAESSTKHVALVDGQLRSDSLPVQLRLQAPSRLNSCWELSPKLSLVPRDTWIDGGPNQVWDSSLTRLRTAAMEFGCSVVCFDSFSWITSRVSQICDGIVLVVTANRTRRLVAAQIRDQIRKARVPLLGVVLAERRLPVPEGLYRNL